jgi:glycosyltransferase involved in cell wall biosynthesis
MLGYLKRCCASVADQERVPFEHIVMDGNSTDGTVEWLGQQRRIAGVVQKDNGMYEAINKGLLLAKGRFVSYLNSDEQYLPDTLNFVREYFDQHPEIDILFGDALLVKPDGSLIAYRKVYQPRWFYIWSSHLYLFSCAMFLRRRIIEEGFQFDERLRVIGDLDFVIRLLRHGYRAAYVRRYLAAFTMTGNNMSAGQTAVLEKKHILDEMAPIWVKSLRLPLNMGRLIEKLMSGAYWQTMPLEYALYVSDVTVKRRTFRVEKASFRWRTR